MKKLLLVLTLLALSVSTVAAAENKEESKEVTAKYVEGSREDVISVDITWGDMEFVYTGADQVWDSADHNYVDKEGSSAEWTVNKNSNNISLVNNSSGALNVALSFTPVASETNLTGTFKEAGVDTAVTSVTMPFNGIGADGSTCELTFNPSGSLVSTDTNFSKVGEITLVISLN